MRLRRKSLRRWSQRKRTDSSQQRGPLVLRKKRHLNRSLRLEHSTVFLPYSRDVTHITSLDKMDLCQNTHLERGFSRMLLL